MKNILTFYYHDNIVSVINLNEYNKQTLTLGRAKDNDIIVNSYIVSQYHAILYLSNFECVIEDNNSTNGLLVNDERVARAKLNSGDNIKIDSNLKHHEEAVVMIFSQVNEEEDQRWVQFFLKDKDVINIGRGSENNIELKHTLVSRSHAQIYRKSDGLYLSDLRSTNGTFLNGLKVTSPVKLKLNDEIIIGNTKLTFLEDRLIYFVITKGVSLDAISVGKTIKEPGTLFIGKKTKRLLSDISVSIKPGQLVAIIGGSGAGKSTFLDALNGSRRANEGIILVNNDDFYSHYDAYKNMTGYVPQQDIVYDTLTVEEMLIYAAKLRMTKDSTKNEIKDRVKQVINDVELNEKEKVHIRNLSGGQKKRVSIAVELLADPQLFFLDEPTSGLDPGMERSLMLLLRKLADSGKTIILITHAMSNLMLCDNIIFLGKGGCLCFFGTPQSALEFFQVDDFIQIYDFISDNSETYCSKFKASNYYIYCKSLTTKQFSRVEIPKTKKQGSFKQFLILTRRYLKLTTSDFQRFVILLAQAPIVALLLGLVTKKDAFSVNESTCQIVFTLACSAVWIGLINSIQEICKEKDIFKRERLVNLKLFPYICSKLLVLGFICLFQSICIVFTFNALNAFPQGFHMVINLKIELIITLFLTLFCATTMGLTISTAVSSNDRAMSIAPFFLVPQIIFSGFIFKLTGLIDKLSSVIIAKWSLRAMAVSLKINELPSKIIDDNKDNLQLLSALQQLKRNLEPAYDHTVSKLYNDWLVLALISFCCILLCAISLRLKDKK